MKIARRGYRRNHGWNDIVPKLSLEVDGKNAWENNVKWNEATGSVEIKTGRTPDPHTAAHHQYAVTLTLADIANLIKILGFAASAENAAKLRDSLKGRLPAIIRLLSCAAGLVPTPIEHDDAHP